MRKIFLLIAFAIAITTNAGSLPVNYNFSLYSASEEFESLQEFAVLEDDSESQPPKVIYSSRVMLPTEIAGNDITELRNAILDSTLTVFKDGELSVSPMIASLNKDDEDKFYGEYYTDAAIINFDTHIMAWEIWSYIYYYWGAHGMPLLKYINYDVEGNKVIGYDDIFLPGTENIIKDAILNTIESNPLIASLIFEPNPETFKITKNIYIDTVNDTIVFVYNPYEIGPFSAGDIRVPIPKYKICDAFTDYANKLLNIIDIADYM